MSRVWLRRFTFDISLFLSINDEIKAWQKLGKPRNLQEWEMYPSMVNAYFNPPANEVHALYQSMIQDFEPFPQIVFPAGIMRPPFFSRAWCVVNDHALFLEAHYHLGQHT